MGFGEEQSVSPVFRILLYHSRCRSGHGCSECTNKKRSTTKKFIIESNKIHNNKYDYSLVDYKNNSTKIKIICPVHGEFEQMPYEHKNNKCGCPVCNDSKGEKIIRNYLIENNIKYQTQKTFEGCRYELPLKFDFYLSEYNTCIEFDGEQHYKIVERWGGKISFDKIQLRDKIKDEYCMNYQLH